MNTHVYLIHGPNLNLLGRRQPEIYGTDTLGDIDARCTALAGELGLTLEAMQSNHEGQIVDWVHRATDAAGGIVLNPGALSHTSIALYDALMAYDGPVIEVHITNIHRREGFRHHSYVSGRAEAVLVGLGTHGYDLAVRHMAKLAIRGRHALGGGR